MNKTGPRVDPELVASPPAMAWYCGDGTNGDEPTLKIIERDGARDAICARFASTPLTQVSISPPTEVVRRACGHGYVMVVRPARLHDPQFGLGPRHTSEKCD